MAVTALGTIPLGENLPVSIAITATGVTNYGTFSIENSPDAHEHTLVLSVVGATALPTTLTVDLEASSDGGTTWGKYSTNTSLALVATTAFVATVVLHVVSGLLYRLNPTAYTAGSSTGATVYGVAC